MNHQTVALLEKQLAQAKESANATPQFVDVRLQQNGGERVLGTIDNLAALMAHYGIEARYNLIHKRVFVSGLVCLPGEEENTLYAEMLSKAALHGMPDKGLAPYLSRIAQLNAYNPVTSYLDTLEGLGGDPIPRFVEHCGFTQGTWAEVACRRWFIQAVAAADCAEHAGNVFARPEFPYVLVLAGDQGLIKTSLMYDLLPAPIRDCFTAGRMLDTNKKDSIFEAIKNWIVELGEIDSTFRKSDIAALKAFLTKQVDDVRLPYARTWSHIPRCTCYMATVKLKFLQDATGNRRFWPLVIVSKIPPVPEGLAEAIWAWAWSEYKAGEQWWLTPDEEVLHAQIVGAHEERPLKERLLDCYDFDSPQRTVPLTCTEILNEIAWSVNDRSATTTLGITLTSMGVERDESKRTYKMPPRTAANVYNL
jgi:putative DNA primase/helicase